MINQFNVQLNYFVATIKLKNLFLFLWNLIQIIKLKDKLDIYVMKRVSNY